MMNTTFFKATVIIAFMLLSMGVFAQQITTTVYFQSIPTKPVDRQQNVTVKFTYYFSGGSSITFPFYIGFVYPTLSAIVPFPVSFPEAVNVTSTKVELSFYDGYTGTGNTFPWIPGLVVCPSDFPVWWVTKSNKDTEN